MRKRILFVDDEPKILEGLRDLLRRQRHQWEMVFVPSGKEALKHLGTTSFDVLVSDMRMPEMDGATLLKRVQHDFPTVVRIVLSGHAELATAIRAIPVAHQFLTKPCHPGTLENVVERACSLQALINDDVVRRTIGKIDRLPSLPRVYSRLLAALANENVSASEVARILEQDMAMCAKLLQLVNSAFFRLSRRISRIEDAVAYLGFNTIKHLALTVEVFQPGGSHRDLKGSSLECLHEHGLLTASIASLLLEEKQEKEDAFIAGLLHDIGKLVLATGLPEQVDQVQAALHDDAGPRHAGERQLNGITHAEVGGYLLGLWGLPYPIVEAVANHHAPNRVRQRRFDILGAVYVANILANEQMAALAGQSCQKSSLDTAYLETLGVAEKAGGWRRMAGRRAQGLASEPAASARS